MSAAPGAFGGPRQEQQDPSVPPSVPLTDFKPGTPYVCCVAPFIAYADTAGDHSSATVTVRVPGHGRVALPRCFAEAFITAVPALDSGDRGEYDSSEVHIPKDEAPLPDSTALTPEERERQLAVEDRKAMVSKFYASIEAKEGSAALLASADVDDGYVTCDSSLDPPLQFVKVKAPTAQQHLRLEANDDGYVRVVFGEGLVLTATSKRSAVGVAEKDDTDAQLWEVVEFSNGHFGLRSFGFVKRLVEAVLDADPVTFALVSDDDSSSFCEFVPKKAEE